MSLIFLSYSSADELEAVALKHGLLDNGLDDVFWTDPERGLKAGERWQEALKRAADRCEAVIFIISPAWAKSKWCLAECMLAKSLNKHIELPGFTRHFELVEILFFELDWRQAVVIAVSPDWVVKHFDIIEHILPCLLTVGIGSSAYALALE